MLPDLCWRKLTMELDEAIQILADWAICSAITHYSCESCSRHDENGKSGACLTAVTEEDVDTALQVLLGEG